MRTGRRIVAFAGAALVLAGCAEQARISLFDEPIIDAALPNPPSPTFEDAGGWPELDASEEEEPALALTSAPLALRYDFEGEGIVVADRAGEANAVIRGGAALDNRGGLELDGVDDYVDMPNGVLSSRQSVTIIAWVHWAGGPCWQRIFDFGSTDRGEDQVGHATTSLFLTPASCPNGVMLSMTEREADQQPVTAARSMPTDRTAQVALVIDGEAARNSLYVDGELEASAPNQHLMSDLHDVNNWLGRSQWIQDGHLNGRYEELRIYDGALTDTEIAELAERGPDRP